MVIKLKKFRVDAAMTQAEIAKAVGVSQPNYQRWESGTAPIPGDKLKKLAKVLNIDANAIFGRHAPIEAGIYDDEIDEALNYYGEVAIHFRGGGEPLLLSISDGQFTHLHHALQKDAPFVTVESLANQLIAIRTKAIADLYFSSEAHDDYGPEHDTYKHIDIKMPDPRDWEIVAELAMDGDLEGFSPADIKRVTERVMITEEQYKTLVSRGRIKPEEMEAEKRKNQVETDLIFDAACKVKYQLSSGVQRSEYVHGSSEIFEAFYDLIDFDGGYPSDDMIVLTVEGRHRVIFINKEAVDYISMPSHLYKAGKTDANAESLDALDSLKRKKAS